ncbi:APC family permease [Streptomyces sp. NPDC093252]|uniref:APC family permease n=1 Tax=Streptomyces sp. NPDC093252 TaxID=3154980 RepID=UPI0034242BB5
MATALPKNPCAPLPEARKMRLLPLVAFIFFCVSGGAYGIEELFSASGPGMGIALLLIAPLIYAIPHALVVAELGTAIPEEGGYYHWVKRGLGRFWGFQQGLLQWICSFVDMAIYPVLFTSYLQSLVADVAPGRHVLLTAGPLEFDLNWFICLAVIVAFTGLNLLGAGRVGESSVLFGILCLTPMLILTVIGFAHLIRNGVNPVGELTSSPGQSAWDAFGDGLFVVMWAYCGWDAVSTVAGEMENPRKHLPRALALSVALIMLSYVLPALAALGVGRDGPEGWANWAEGSFSDVALHLAGPWLQWTVTIGGMVAAVALFSALLASYSRLPYALARDRYLPAVFARESPRRKVPVVAVIGSSVVYAMFCMSSFADLIVFNVFLTNLGILLEVAALIALRVREPHLRRPFRIPGGWFSVGLVTVSLLGISVWATWQQYVSEGRQAVTYCLVVVGGSFLLYFPLARRADRLTRAAERETERGTESSRETAAV